MISVKNLGSTTVIAIDRPQARNAVDPATATALYEAFQSFDADDNQKVAILTGNNGVFCAGFDLKAAAGAIDESWFDEHDLGPTTERGSEGPMGPTRLTLSKPVIAAIAGPAVAGGMELALWCDMRVMEESAYMGVYCRRWGVPLIDGGTVRLPRIVGHGRAMDLILTGRKVEADEAAQMGLANRVCADGRSLEVALELAEQLSQFPQACMRADRLSAINQWGLGLDDALVSEWQSADTFRKEGVAGAARFASGKGRGGDFGDI